MLLNVCVQSRVDTILARENFRLWGDNDNISFEKESIERWIISIGVLLCCSLVAKGNAQWVSWDHNMDFSLVVLNEASVSPDFFTQKVAAAAIFCELSN